MRGYLLAVLTALAGVAWGQQFSLQDSGGKTYGPFELKEGSHVKVGKADLTVSNVKTAEDAVLDKLNKIRLPAVEFQDASLEEVVNSLRKVSVEADPEKKGVNLVLDLSGRGMLPPEEYVSVSKDEISTNVLVKVSFDGKDITLQEALKAVALLAEIKYMVTGNLVVLCPINAPESPIVVRTYDVLNSFVEITERTIDEVDPDPRTSNHARWDLKQLFGEMGVKWPIGSYIKHVPSIGKLTVANTETNLVIFESKLACLNVTPCEIQIEVNFVAFEKADVARLGPGGISQDALLGLWTNGHAELIASPCVITKAGQEATAKGVTECVYPTEFEVEPLITGEGEDARVVGGIAEPGSFETREVGVIIAVMAEVSSEGQMINLTMTPEVVFDPIWHNYGSTYTDTKGKERRMNMEYPFFHTHTVTTQAALFNGATLLIGGGIPLKDGRKLMFTFVTARLVDPHGKPVLRR